MTLDITQWAERYGQWRQASLTATTLPIYTVFLIAPAMMMVFGAMYVDGGRIARTVAVLLAVPCVALLPGYWGHSIYESTLKPAPLIQVVEEGYGITSLSCGEDGIMENGWRSCTALKDRRLLDLKIDKEDARVTVYDRHTGGGLETVK